MPSSELAPVTRAAFPRISNTPSCAQPNNAAKSPLSFDGNRKGSRFFLRDRIFGGKPPHALPENMQILSARHLGRLGDKVLRQARHRPQHRLDLLAGARIDLELALLHLVEEGAILHGGVECAPQRVDAV